MEPLLALDRWIRYTQSELQSLRADTIQQREEQNAVHRIQQIYLDSIQGQVRENFQQSSVGSVPQVPSSRASGFANAQIRQELRPQLDIAQCAELAETITDVCNHVRQNS